MFLVMPNETSVNMSTRSKQINVVTTRKQESLQATLIVKLETKNTPFVRSAITFLSSFAFRSILHFGNIF